MSAASALASACPAGDQMVVIEVEVSCRFVATLRVHHRTLKRRLAATEEGGSEIEHWQAGVRSILPCNLESHPFPKHMRNASIARKGLHARLDSILSTPTTKWPKSRSATAQSRWRRVRRWQPTSIRVLCPAMTMQAIC